MKKEVKEALTRLQEDLRENGPYGGMIVSVEDVQAILQWAEKKGLRPDLQGGDRVEAKPLVELTHFWSGTKLPVGAKGVVYQVIPNNPYKDVRVVWDDDPLEEKEPVYVKIKHLRRVYDE